MKMSACESKSKVWRPLSFDATSRSVGSAHQILALTGHRTNLLRINDSHEGGDGTSLELYFTVIYNLLMKYI